MIVANTRNYGVGSHALCSKLTGVIYWVARGETVCPSTVTKSNHIIGNSWTKTINEVVEHQHFVVVEVQPRKTQKTNARSM